MVLPQPAKPLTPRVRRRRDFDFRAATRVYNVDMGAAHAACADDAQPDFIHKTSPTA